MSQASPTSLHGHVVFDDKLYSRMLDTGPTPARHDLEVLAKAMEDLPDQQSDNPDPEENLFVPAGYTYLGQFIDHDLTFDTTSSLKLGVDDPPTNKRTPAFDLDNLYGAGPDAAPFMYVDGIRLIEGINDLPRSVAPSERAIIGDPRNDENSIVCNLQMAFIRFHNLVVDKLQDLHPHLAGTKALFTKAQQEVRWTYQKIIVEDFLKRIVPVDLLDGFERVRDPDAQGKSRDTTAFKLYVADSEMRRLIPIEFSGAAYRFGHSMVRTGYRLNDKFGANIFAPHGSLSLVGFQRLLPEHLITDWSIFFPSPDGTSASIVPGMKDAENKVSGKKRLQFAYKIDTTFVNPLGHLPPAIATNPSNLGLRNLERGAKFSLASGQQAAKRLGTTPLDASRLLVRDKSAGKNKQTFRQIPAALRNETPLWFYVLAEAQAPIIDWWMGLPVENLERCFTEDQFHAAAAATATQLGPVGGRIVVEVFNGLLDDDPTSYRNDPAARHWRPLIESFTMWNLVNGTLNN